MSGSDVVFYLLALFTVGNALLAVTSGKIFRAAIFLLFSLVGTAGLYFWMSYEFIAAVQIVVYVGGITVLIIFSIFLTQQSGEKLPKQSLARVVFSAIAVLLGFVFTTYQILGYSFSGNTANAITPDVENIGRQMLDVHDVGFALPFEVVSILLLAALVGCIVIAMKSKFVKS